MMQPEDIRKIAIWCYNTNFEDFCNGIYGEPGTGRSMSKTNYLYNKYIRMQDKPVLFICELDCANLRRFTATLNTYDS